MCSTSNRFRLFACTKVDCKNYDIEITLDDEGYLQIKCNECGSVERVKLPNDSSLLQYKHMWNNLKSYLESKREFHESGEMQSISESIHGKATCDEMISHMKIIEEKYKKY